MWYSPRLDPTFFLPVPAGVVTLLSDYEVCKEGDVLTPEQARVLVSNRLAAQLCRYSSAAASISIQ